MGVLEAGPSGVPRLDPAWLRRTARRAGCPSVALEACARAEVRAPEGCGVGWVES